MLIKTISFAALFMLLCVQVSAQETIDARVLKNRGKQAETAFQYNKNSYNYYVFELDKSHYVTTVSELTSAEQALLQSATLFKNAANEAISYEIAVSNTFNFYDFGIKLQKEHRIYIALDANKVLVFYSIPEMSQLFKNSEFNTK